MSSNQRIVSVVDDDISTVTMFYEALRENFQEISVFSFTDPVKAFEHFISNKSEYFPIVSDLRMPRLNGLELLKKIKTANPKVRTLLMTAFEIDDPLFEEYRKEGIINDLLQKPIRLNDLRSIVEKHLDMYKKLKNKKLSKPDGSWMTS